jgi:hypothetical protein
MFLFFGFPALEGFPWRVFYSCRGRFNEEILGITKNKVPG